MRYQYRYESPLGEMFMICDGEALMQLKFGSLNEKYEEKNMPIFQETIRWLDLYFSGKKPDFMPEIRLEGTLFQQEVWRILQEIPYGKIRTYGEIAAEIAKKRGINRMSAQAVGGAVGRNPIAILVPCHRVIGVGKRLVGYAGGIHRKEELLKIEGMRYEQ